MERVARGRIPDSRQWWVIATVLVVVWLFGLPMGWLLSEVDLGKVFVSGWFTGSLSLFWKSALLCLLVALCCTIVGSLAAVGILHLPSKARWLSLVILVMPLFIPSYIHGLILNQLLPPVVNTANVADATNAANALAWLKTFLSLSASYYGIPLLIMLAALSRWDHRMQEAAWLHGNRWHAFIYIYLRYFSGPFIIGIILVYLLSFSNFAVPDFFQVPVYAVEIFVQVTSYKDISGALGVSLLPTLIGLIFLCCLVLASKRVYLQSSKGQDFLLVRQRHPMSAGLAMAGVLTLILVAVVVPMASLIYTVGSVNILFRAIELAWQDTFYSMLFAGVTALLCVILGLFAAYGYARKLIPAGNGFRVFVLMLFVIPAMFHGLGLIKLWNREGVMGAIYDSGALIFIGLSIRWLPVAFEILANSIKQIDISMEEAAYLTGASWFYCFTQVILRQLWRVILLVFVVIYVFSFNELGLTLLLTPPGVSSLPGRIFSFVHYGTDDLLAALCLWQVIVLAIPLGMIFWLFHRVTHVAKSNNKIMPS